MAPGTLVLGGKFRGWRKVTHGASQTSPSPDQVRSYPKEVEDKTDPKVSNAANFLLRSATIDKFLPRHAYPTQSSSSSDSRPGPTDRSRGSLQARLSNWATHHRTPMFFSRERWCAREAFGQLASHSLTSLSRLENLTIGPVGFRPPGPLSRPDSPERDERNAD